MPNSVSLPSPDVMTFTADKPWEAIDIGNAGAAAVPSMINPVERRYLYWLARDYYAGRGAIVDGGPLLGSSTVTLAEGLRQNPRLAGKTGRIHSYDIFEYWPYMRGLFAGEAEPAPGESLLPRYLSYIRPWQDLVEVHPGDVTQHAWTGGPIEILFVDLAKSWDLQTHLLREFFPALIPGVSIVVQQDYFHHYCYWITLVMEYLADYFTPVHLPCGGTLGLALTREIPAPLLQRDYKHFFSQADAEALFARAASRFTGARRLLTATAKVSMLLAYGDITAAIETLEAIRRSPDYNASVHYDFLAAVARVKARAVADSVSNLLAPSTRDEILHRCETLIPGRERTIWFMAQAAASGRPLYLWGAGQGGRGLLQTLRERSVQVTGFVDRDARKTGTRVDGLTVSAPAALDPAGQPRPFVGVSGMFAHEIATELAAGGWKPEIDYAVL